MAKRKNDDSSRFSSVNRKSVYAQHRKITIPSSDTGTYDYSTPVPTPDATEDAITITDLEELYWTEPLTNKAINLKADRLIGDGFELIPSDEVGVNPHIAEQAKEECWKFLRQIGYITFFKQSAINAYVSGNEWTELILNPFRNIVNINHGDFKTIDYRRDFLTNRILLNSQGEPVGYWQYIEDLSILYQGLSTLYGSIDTYENLKAAKDRLKESQTRTVVDEHGREIALISARPQYMFLNKDEIIHLSFNNLNDNWYGSSMILPAYNAITHLKQILFATSEYIDEIGLPKAVLKIGDSEHPPDENMNDMAEDMVQDPVRKEAFVIPYYADLQYLQPTGGAVDVNSFPEQFITMVSVGLGVPRELLAGEGDSNRATALSNSSDFEKAIEADRRVLEEYILEILGRFLASRNFETTDDERSIYVPKIKWPKFITEDEKVRKELIRADWESGAITFNEYRELLGYNEVEDRERGEKYYEELHTSPAEGTSMGIFKSEANGITTHPASVQEAQFRLEPKEELNPALNERFRTDDVDYKNIAQEKVGTKIKTVGKKKAVEIRDTLVNEVAKGTVNLKATTEKIQEIGNYKPYEAKRIVRTEISNLANTARDKNAREKGLTHKRWQAVVDKKTSNLSKALDGQTVPIDEDFEVTYTDENGKRQTWKGSQPPEHPNTRCKLIYFADDPGDLTRFQPFSSEDLNKITEEMGDLTKEDFKSDKITETISKRTKIPKSKLDANYFDILSLGFGEKALQKILKPGKLGTNEVKQFTKIANSVRGSPRKVKNLTKVLTRSVKNKKKLTRLLSIMELGGGKK